MRIVNSGIIPNIVQSENYEDGGLYTHKEGWLIQVEDEEGGIWVSEVYDDELRADDCRLMLGSSFNHTTDWTMVGKAFSQYGKPY